MNILVFTSLYPNKKFPFLGNFVKERVKYFTKHGNVRVFSPVRYIPFFLSTKEIPEIIRKDDTVIYHPKYFVFPGILKWTDGFLYALSVFTKVLILHKEKRIDVIDAHWGYPDGFAAFLIGKLLGVPVIVTLRGSDINIFMNKSIRGSLIKYYLKHIDGVICVSEALKNVLTENKIVPNNIRVIQNGVDQTKFKLRNKIDCRNKLNLNNNAKIVLAVNNLVYVKGVDILIEAFSCLNDDTAILMIIGDGELRDELELKRSHYSHQVLSRIIFTGRKPHSEISVWLSACDIFVLASRNEGCPNVVLEALASGRPVVATNVGGVSDIITDSKLGVVVPKENTEKLKDAIDIALKTQWDEIYINNYSNIYSWDETAVECANLWQSVIDNRN
jgi:glycosyltransferase involved in cell wall biosynthesis